jgi:Family of unknown function (DUF5819)
MESQQGPEGAEPEAVGPGPEPGAPGPEPPVRGRADEDESALDAALPPPPSGGRWSPGARIAIAAAIAAVAIGAAIHLGMVFLHIAPSNTIYKENSKTVDGYVYPEFEQNWKLFAPNPLQQNVHVQARAQVLAGGQDTTTGWVDLTAEDTAAVHHNPAPSHVDQNLLRRAFDFYTGSHGTDGKPIGERGLISQDYLRRIAAQRLGPHLDGGTVQQVQLRSVSTPVAPARWSHETIDLKPTTDELPWWTVTKEDFR